MSRWAWSILGAIVVVLGIYAFRPSEAAPQAVSFVTIQPGTRYTLTAQGRTQVVEGERLVLDGLVRVADTDLTGRLWGTLVNLKVDSSRIITGVTVTDLAAYGLAKTSDLEGSTPLGPVHLKWGRSGAQAYLWDALSSRLVAVDPALVDALEQSAGRLDKRAVLTIPPTLNRLAVDGLVMIHGAGGWTTELATQRPPFDTRVQRLLGLLSAVNLDDLAAPPVTMLPFLGRIELGLGADAHAVAVHGSGDDLRVAVDQLPAQRITDAAAWRAALAAFRVDVLTNVTNAVGGRHRIEAVRVRRAGAPVLALVRGEQLAKSQDYRWEVVWPTGREPADPEALNRVLDLLDDLRLTAPVAEAEDAQRLAARSGLVVTIEAEDQTSQIIALDDDLTLRSTRHHGRAVEPERLRAALAPAALLNPHLATRNPQRIAKIQRRIPAEGRSEVLTKAEGGTWRHTWPVPVVPADGGAIDRLIRTLASARATSIDLAQTPADRAKAQAILTNPTVELAVRYAPAELGQAANDETDLDETAAQDWGLAMIKEGDHWLGTDGEGDLLLTLDAETVDALLAPIEPGRLFPLVPATVTAIEGTTAAGHWRIERSATGWTVTSKDASGRVDDLAVRRLLRTLSTLPGIPDARQPEPTAATSSLIIEVPAIATGITRGSERLRLVLADSKAWIGSDRPGSAFPRGGAPAPAFTVPALADLLVRP